MKKPSTFVISNFVTGALIAYFLYSLDLSKLMWIDYLIFVALLVAFVSNIRGIILRAKVKKLKKEKELADSN